MRAAGRRGGRRRHRPALEPGDRTQLRTLGLGLAASRFPPRLPDPLEDPSAGRIEPAEGDRRPPLGPRNRTPAGLGGGPLLSMSSSRAPRSQGMQVSRSQRPTGGCLGKGRQHLIAWGHGRAVCCRDLFVVLTRGGGVAGSSFSDQRALPVLKGPGADGAGEPLLLAGPKS